MTEVIPAGWRGAVVGDLVEQCGERAGRRSKPVVLSSTKYRGLVPSDEYFQGRAIYSSDLSNYKLVKRHWFAYATNHLAEGSIGIQDRYEVGCVSPIYTVFRCKEGVDPNFLYRVLKSPALLAQYELREQASVNRRGAIRFSDFARIRVRLPEAIIEQQRITEILNAVDDRIRMTQLVIEKYEIIAKAISVVIPDTSWQWSPLGEVAAVAAGLTLGAEPSGPGSVALPYLRVANVQDGHIDTSEMKTVRVLRTDVARYSARPGDLLLTEGGDFDKLGRGAVWDGRIEPCLHQNHVFRIRCRPDLIIPGYLALYTASPLGRRYFISVAKQTTNLASINSRQLKAMPVPIPPLHDQERLLSVVSDARSALAAEQAELDKLRLAKKGLMDDLLGGKVRVGKM